MPNMSAALDYYQNSNKPCDSNTSQDLVMHFMALSDTREQSGIDPGIVMSSDVHGMVSQMQPRFGDGANCPQMQINPVQYPFTSHDGAVTFYRQQSGNRVFDFNADGLAHLGLIPDMIEDMRRQGVSEQYLDRIFRGAESYLQAWEKSIRQSRQFE